MLEGLLEYERATGGTPESREARASGEEYLLERSLFRRLSTGEPADERFLRFLHPNRWRYDVLRALDYFRAAAALTGAAPDPRLGEAVDHVRSRRLARRHLAARLDPARPGLVRRRRRAGPALALGDAARDAGAQLVGAVGPVRPGRSRPERRPDDSHESGRPISREPSRGVDRGSGRLAPAWANPLEARS